MMKSQTAHLTGLEKSPVTTGDWQIRIPAMVINLRQVAAVLSAAMAVLLLVTLSVWVAELEVTRFASSAGWGAAFVMMAAAVDNRRGTAALQVLTALAMAALAWAQLSMAAEWGIVSAALLAPWLAVAVYKGLWQRSVSNEQ